MIIPARPARKKIHLSTILAFWIIALQLIWLLCGSATFAGQNYNRAAAWLGGDGNWSDPNWSFTPAAPGISFPDNSNGYFWSCTIDAGTSNLNVSVNSFTLFGNLTVGSLDTYSTGSGGVNLDFNGLPFSLQTSVGGLGTLINHGTLTPSTTNGGSFYGNLDNRGTLQIQQNFTIQQGNLTNEANAQIQLNGGGNLQVQNGGVTNAGSVQVDSGQFSIQNGALVNTGSVNVGNGGSLSATAFTNSANATIFDSGNFDASNGGASVNNGSITLTPGARLGATSLTNNSMITLYNANTLSSDSTFTNTSTASITGSGLIYAQNAFTNAGAVTANFGSLTLVSFTGTLTNTGTLSNAVGASLFLSAPTFLQQGHITVNSAGAITSAIALSNQSGAVITLNGGTLGASTITNQSGGTINGFGTLSGNVVNAGSMTFSGAVRIIGTLNNQSGATLTLQHETSIVTAAATNTGTIAVASGGILFEAGLTGTPPVGGLSPATSGGGSAGDITVSPGAALTANYIRQNSLTVNGVAGNPGIVAIATKANGGDISTLNTLSLVGTMDLANTGLLVHTTSLSTINTYLASHLLTSSTAIAGKTTLAAISGGKYLALHGAQSTFFGQSILSTDALVKFTYFGDATLDGILSVDDYLQIDDALARHTANPTWVDGDFTGDGIINAADYALLDTNFKSQSGPLADAEIAAHTAEFGQPYLDALATLNPSPIPEPASLALMGVGAMALLNSRRRNSVCRFH